MTKKKFKEMCSFHVYGRGANKRNAIYFDWQTNSKGNNGFKYMVKTSVQNYKLNELFNILYDWVNKEIQPDYYVHYRYASTDEQRFKVNLMG